MSGDYRNKFIAFLESLEMQNIDEFIELPYDNIRAVGITMSSYLKDIISLTAEIYALKAQRDGVVLDAMIAPDPDGRNVFDGCGAGPVDAPAVPSRKMPERIGRVFAWAKGVTA